MGGVDMLGKYLHSLSPQRATKKTWTAVAWWAIGLSVYQTFVIARNLPQFADRFAAFKRSGDGVYRSFVRELMIELRDDRSLRPPAPVPPVDASHEHVQPNDVSEGAMRNCEFVQCTTRTRKWCSACEWWLCAVHFDEAHYKNVKPAFRRRK